MEGIADKRGYVYILVNPAFPGFLKIGKTTKEPEARARELSSVSGVPAPYAVAWDVFVNDCDHVEKLVHQQLAHARSRNDREFFALPLRNAISIVSSIVGPFSCECNTGLVKTPALVNSVSPPVESKITGDTTSLIGLRVVSSLEAAGYSSLEIDDLQSAVASFERLILPHKRKREAEAEDILLRSRGEYTNKILEEVFDKVDKGPIGPVAGLWFGQLLVRPNRNRLYCSPLEELRALIDRLRETGDLGCLGEWRRAGNSGMKTGVATLLMYLHSPERYNIWLPKTHGGLLRLRDLGTGFPKSGDEPSPEEYRVLYKVFNENAVVVREESGLAPQTMDWFLFAVDEIKTNPANPGLRALIENRIE